MKKYKKIYIEITNQCNLSCSFCQVTNRTIWSMSFDEFDYILNQISPYTDYIYLHIKGEPLLHDRLLDFIALLAQKKLTVIITTNGTLIHNYPELITYSNIRQINFSLHSLLELPDAIFQKSLDTITAFIKNAQKKTNIFFALRFWNLNINKSITSDENLSIIHQLIRDFNPSEDCIEKITHSINSKLSDKVFIHFDSVFDWPDIDSTYNQTTGFCYGLRDQIGILSDGTVVPCCLDGEGVINLGNIFKSDFQTIIDSDRATSIVNGFSNNKAVENLCIKCSFKKRF
ncbi:MAG: hypothetical protein A2015_09395 [Spirochaetes bacterium GWF1_31_7]|nr:MAG: hypothetical protein A2Y30_03125 [Spirochaetes bacterium GWE1_32_154]OHD48323.1 MAG: hypothetical protein A2Y29_05640 [Spirochaetes bacterium GWE2_31_10]OHD53015.1 MAG: hypothetical protein A2015_09395 [Spirochaetes bacterium GWF1_31_7]OHD80396.1 MAG: hypothetical protein A2355_13190 [Spirochaetes bacterium RIFOXYB1_FULL_32_8]HBD95946.1 radical SAM protein [Spirochaetia bacterium]